MSARGLLELPGNPAWSHPDLLEVHGWRPDEDLLKDICAKEGRGDAREVAEPTPGGPTARITRSTRKAGAAAKT
eukprot:3547542-Alexandrium_andersonii.AAC.1